jgi:hypothetical protein
MKPYNIKHSRKNSITINQFRAGMGKNNIYESNDLFKYEKIACQG